MRARAGRSIDRATLRDIDKRGAQVVVTSSKGKRTSRPSGRRRGVETSATRAKLIAAAALLIVEEGYAAVTARRVASRAGLKPQLVHYYFPTMDDLLVGVIRQRGDLHLERLAKVVVSENPLNAVWKIGRDKESALMSMQLLALAAHRKAIRTEVRRYTEQLRLLQTAALERHLAVMRIKPTIAPITMTLVASSVANLMLLEAVLGVSLGHSQTRSAVEQYLKALEHGPDSDVAIESRRSPRPRSAGQPKARPRRSQA